MFSDALLLDAHDENLKEETTIFALAISSLSLSFIMFPVSSSLTCCLSHALVQRIQNNVIVQHT